MLPEGIQKLLQRLESQGGIRLPEKRDSSPPSLTQPVATKRTDPRGPVTGKLSGIGRVDLRVATDKEEDFCLSAC